MFVIVIIIRLTRAISIYGEEDQLLLLLSPVGPRRPAEVTQNKFVPAHSRHLTKAAADDTLLLIFGDGCGMVDDNLF